MNTRNVFVTGAATGIGRAAAMALADRGWQVYAGVLFAEQAESLSQLPRANVTPILCDVTKADSIHLACERIGEAVGPSGLGGLVNNAGVAVAGPIECVPIDQLRRQLDVNVLGPLAVTQAMLPLVRAGSGRIVNVGSTAGRLAVSFMGPYAMSKSAISAATDALRQELAPEGIPVILIEPGFIETAIWDSSCQAAEGLLDGVPAEQGGRYRARLRKFAWHVHKDRHLASPARVVADTIVAALEGPRPRTRYLVGAFGLRTALLALLPDRLRDQILTRIVPPPRDESEWRLAPRAW